MGENKMRLVVLACILGVASASFKWDSCGTKNDRLKTTKVKVEGAFAAGSKVTVTASGNTDLHVPLDSGAWQVRIYELGVAKETHTEFGDLMKVLKFDDAKNTTFTVTVSFTLPKKVASGKFDANLVATDQAKSDYMCLDVKYDYAAEASEVDSDTTTVYSLEQVAKTGDCAQVDVPTKYVKQAMEFDKNLKEGTCASAGYSVADGSTSRKVPVIGQLTIKNFKKAAVSALQVEATSVYCNKDPTKKPPYYCHAPPLPTSCTKNSDCVTPWYNSWCMNDASKHAPYVCKEELPPKCNVDKDCQRS